MSPVLPSEGDRAAKNDHEQTLLDGYQISKAKARREDANPRQSGNANVRRNALAIVILDPARVGQKAHNSAHDKAAYR
jgi:hypothetical protein